MIFCQVGRGGSLSLKDVTGCDYMGISSICDS